MVLTIESSLESVIKMAEAQLVLLKYLSRKVAIYDKSILCVCKLRKRDAQYLPYLGDDPRMSVAHVGDRSTICIARHGIIHLDFESSSLKRDLTHFQSS